MVHELAHLFLDLETLLRELVRHHDLNSSNLKMTSIQCRPRIGTGQIAVSDETLVEMSDSRRVHSRSVTRPMIGSASQRSTWRVGQVWYNPVAPTSHQVELASYPEGEIRTSDFRIVEVDVPDLRTGEGAW